MEFSGLLTLAIFGVAGILAIVFMVRKNQSRAVLEPPTKPPGLDQQPEEALRVIIQPLRRVRSLQMKRQWLEWSAQAVLKAVNASSRQKSRKAKRRMYAA